MWDIVYKIIKSEIMFYVIIPLSIVFLNWVKGSYDIKKKNKELGYWSIKYRRLPTFMDIAMKLYKRLTLILIISIIIRKGIILWTENIISIVFAYLFFLLFGAIFVFIFFKKVTNKVEFLTNGRVKKKLIIMLYLIFISVCILNDCIKYKYIIQIVLIIALLIWMFFVSEYCDIVFILDKSYADIHMKGIEKVEFAVAGSIIKKGGWVIVNRYSNGYDEEIRIKESDIERIDYYGEPIVIVEKYFFKFKN